jgi:hypothetical protein
MEPLNRVALLVRPKRRYKEWADSVADGDDDPMFDLEQPRIASAVYLVAARHGDPLQDLIDDYAADIFEAELEGWSTDETRWPANRSPHVFRDWFDVTLGEVVVDLDPGEPMEIDFDDEDVEAEESDLLAALSGDPGATLRCAWCEVVIERDDPVVIVDLKGPRTPHPEPEVIDLAVGGRVFPAVVPSDDSDGGRAGLMAFVSFCGDGCASAFREAWNRERGAVSS